jgi:hypothetical protein
MIVRGFETADGRTVEHGQVGGFREVADLEAERKLADVLVGACAERPRDGAHDVSDGGLAQAPVDGVLRYGTGARVALPLDLDPFVALFSESAARAVVAMRAGTELRVREFCEATGVPYTAIGTTGGDALPVGDLFDVRLDELRALDRTEAPGQDQELKPLLHINPAKYGQTAHGPPRPIAPFVANFSMRCTPQAVPPTAWPRRSHDSRHKRCGPVHIRSPSAAGSGIRRGRTDRGS